MNRISLTAGLILAGIALSGRAEAQLFGARTFGQSLQPQASPGGGNFGGPVPAPGITPGGGSGSQSAINSSARFLRQNRGSDDFVGKDPNGPTRQVGVSQALPDANTLQSAAMDLVERRIPEAVLNPPRTPSRSRMYEPKLVVGFRPMPLPPTVLTANLNAHMSRLTQLDPDLQMEMTLQGSTLILTGQASSEEARALIEQVMLFEPGISAVQNDLKVPSAGP